MSDSHARVDGLANCLTGLGDDPDLDTRMRTRRTESVQPTTYALEAEWRQSWMAWREVSQLAGDMFREGFDVTNIMPEDVDVAAIRSWIEGDLTVGPDGTPDDLKGITYYAHKLREEGDKMGGAALLVIVDDGLDPIEPLDLRRVQRIVGWEVFDRSEITPWLGSYGYNVEPEYFVLSDIWTTPTRERKLQPGDIIHRSRLIVHKGVELSRRAERNRNWWGDSVLERNARERRGAEEGNEYARTYMDRMSWLHLSMADLTGLLTETDEHGNEIGEEVVRGRIKTIRKFARTLGIVVTDGGRKGFTQIDSQQEVGERLPDKLESINESPGELEELIRLNLDQWAYGTIMPRSIAFGEAGKGINTGDNAGDWQTWTGRVRDEQNTWGTYVINRMLLVTFAAKEGPTGGVIPEHWEIDWRPLIVPTPKEKADIAKIQAEADAVRISSNVARPADVTKQRLVLGDVDGPLRVTEDPTEQVEEAQVEPAQVGIATAVLEGAIATAMGQITPEFYASYLTSIDSERYPANRAREIAERIRSFGSEEGMAEGATEVPTEDAEPSALDVALAEMPGDLMTPKDIVEDIKQRLGLDVGTRRVHSLAKRYQARSGRVGSQRGYSLEDIKRALLRDNGRDPGAEDGGPNSGPSGP